MPRATISSNASTFSSCFTSAFVFLAASGFAEADAFVTAFLPFYLLAVAAVFRLRGRPGYAPTFRVPFFPFVPLLFIASVLYLLGNALVQTNSRMPTLIVLGMVATGIPVFFLTVGRGGGVKE